MAAVKRSVFIPLILLFILINSATLFLANRLDKIHIDHVVLMVVNLVLFSLSALSLLMHSKAAANKNPNVFVRSIMLATVLKLLVIMIGIVLYVYNAGETRSNYAIYAGMLLYIFYTILEVKGALKLNKKTNGAH